LPTTAGSFPPATGLFDRADAADVEADARVELERVPARRRLGAPEHDADLHSNLVDEDEQAVRSCDGRRELAERLAHEARLQTDVAIAHVAFDFGLRHEGGHGVDDDDVDRVRPHEHVGDLERLLAVVGLADEELVGLHAELARVARVERVLGVDERRHAPGLLDLGDRVERERGLAARFGPVDLDDAPPRVAADAERMSRPMLPVGVTCTPSVMACPSLRRMIEPLPYSFSMLATARSIALLLFLMSSMANRPRAVRVGARPR